MPDSNYNLQRENIVRKALRKLGATSPSIDEITNGVQSLQLLIKEVDAEGKWLHCISNTEQSLTLSSGTRTYTAGSGAAQIRTDMLALESFILLIGTSRIPVEILGKREALTTTLLEGTGQPLAVFLEVKSDPADNVLWVYQLPDATYTAKYTYRRHLYDFDASTDYADLPRAWVNCLIYLVAADLAPEYDVDSTLIEAKAQAKLRRCKALNAGDVPQTNGFRTHYF